MTFLLLAGGKPPAELNLDHVYLTSQEGQPIRARFQYAAATGLLFCERRSQGLASLNLPWPTRDGSRMMLRSSMLQDREAPYLLTLELARGQVAEVWRKKDEWGYSYGGPTDLIEKTFREIKLLLAHAQTVQDNPLAAGDLAEEALAKALIIGERLAVDDAKRGLAIRRRRGELDHLDFGCHWEAAEVHARTWQRFGETFNCATVPMVWRAIEPREHEFNWKWYDDWIQWLEAKGLSIKGGSLIRFTEMQLPDWVWIWENDFETIRDSVFDHIERCVQRYRGRVDYWDAVTGLHVENCMNFSLDRLIEITRVCCHAVKRADPAAKSVLDLVAPWGEYYAHNQKSIWPYHYAEMCLSAGVVFDAIGLQIFAGSPGAGFHVRDMMAISDLLDRFGALGKPLHITAVGVPSARGPDSGAAVNGPDPSGHAGGIWHKPWDETVQSEWLDAFYRIAVSKPYVTSVSWRDFTDHQSHYLPHGGLLRKDLHPKVAFQRLGAFRQEIWPQAGAKSDEDSNVLWPES
jgi:GH35 family endo-1,4-beta-xylanase